MLIVAVAVPMDLLLPAVIIALGIIVCADVCNCLPFRENEDVVDIQVTIGEDDEKEEII